MTALLTFERLLVSLPDVEGLVHGIVSIDPPKVQCDGCGLVVAGPHGRLAITVILCGIRFHYTNRERRLCDDCGIAERGTP